MNDPKAMLELAERVEKASGPDRELDRLIDPIARSDVVEWPGGGLARKLHDGRHAVHSAAHYTASLDAAMALVPKRWLIERQGEYPFPDIENRPFFAGLRPRIFGDARRVFVLDAAAPALALTAACLRALANGGNHG